MAKSSSQLADQKLIEISQNLAGDTIPLSMNDIRQPNAVSVNKFYTHYLEDLGIEVVSPVDVPTYRSLAHPEIHLTMLRYGMLAKAMQFFLTKINSGMTFSVSDIINPVPSRHRMFLGELLNCHNFAMAVQPMVEVSFNNWTQREENLKKLREQLEQLQNQKSQLLLERGVREDKVKDFEKRKDLANQQCNKLSSEMSDHRQLTMELQQELEEHSQKHQQLLQSKELHINKLKQLESQLVNSPQRFKQDLSIVKASLQTLQSEVQEREATLASRQDMEKHLAEYLQVLREVKEMATHMGELKKKSLRTAAKLNELMGERKKLISGNEKLAKEKISLTERYNKLLQKSSSMNQTQNRKVEEMSKTLRKYEDEEQKLSDLLEATHMAIRTYEMEKNELDFVLNRSSAYEAAAVELLNEMHEIGTERIVDEANAIFIKKFEQLKTDFE